MNIYIEDDLGAGVYCIRNIRTGKKYIGQSFNITNRLSTHFQQLKFGKHTIKDLQDDFNRGDRFDYQILFTVNATSKDYLRKILITMEHEHIARTSSSMLYNTDLSEPYIWNTVIQIPESIRTDDRYHVGDICRLEFQKYIIRDHSERERSINLDKIKSDIDSWGISEMLKAEIISKVLSVSAI